MAISITALHQVQAYMAWTPDFFQGGPGGGRARGGGNSLKTPFEGQLFSPIYDL
jgi:hypothetical protein